ncbi:hypothetical protein [Aquabacterium sp.]|uniref:hypothetical protein n=1 Tax=Aquabacterium sp. TaxID=1872578 RepID=UPI0040379707
MKFTMTVLYEKGVVVPRLLALSLILSSSLLGCHAQKPEYARDPEGVNRSAKPQILVKKDDVYLDGHLIRMRSTTAEQVRALTGKDPSNQTEITALFNATGLRIHAGVDDQKVGNLNLFQSVQIWVRQEDDYGKHRDCDEAELKRHRDSVTERIQLIEQNDLKKGWNRVELKEKVRNEECTVAGKTPEHAFAGYLEVDGLPIGPNMSLKEIQARRKRLGLEPLYQDSGPQYYVAPKAKTGPEWNQTWVFDVTVGDGGVVLDQRLKAITIP